MEAFSCFATMGIMDAVSGPLGKMRQAFVSTGSQGNRFGNTMGGIAKKMMPLAVVAGLLLASLAPTIGVAADFEAGISNLGAISRASAGEMALMEQSALDLGASTAFSAGQVVDAQTELAKKGFDANQVVGAMPGLLDLAAAAQADLSTAATVSSGALKSFNMAADESGLAADIIASASTSSATDIEGIGMALQNAGAVVAGAGGDFALLTAITGKLADANINAAVAGTATKIMFNRLQAPTGAAAKALADLGVVTKDANGNMLPFLDIMGSLETSLAGMGTADKAATLKNIFGEEAIGSVTALLNQGIGSLGEYADTLRNSTGSAAEMAAKKLDNLKGSLTILGSATEGLSITVGSIFTPILKPLVDMLTTVVGWLNVMAGHPLGKTVLLMAAGISVAVIALTVFSGVMWAASAAAAVLNLTLLANPIGLVVMGLFAMGAVIVAFWDDIAGLFKPLTLVVGGVIAVFKSLSGTIGTIDGQLAEDLQAAGLVGLVTTVSRVMFRIKEAWCSAWDAMIITMEGIGAIFVPVIDTVADAFKPLWQIITYVTSALFGASESTDVSSWQTFGAVVGVVVGSAFELLAWGIRIAMIPLTLCITLVGWLLSAFVGLGEGIGIAAGWIVGHVGTIWNGIKWAFMNLTPLGWMIQAFNGIKGFLEGFDLSESGAKLMHTLASGIKSAIMMPFNMVKGGLTKLRNLLPFSDAKEGPLSTLTLSGARMMETLATGVQGAAPVLTKSAAGAMAGVTLAVGTAVADPTQYTSGYDNLPAVATPYERVKEEQAGAGGDGSIRSEGNKVVIENLHVSLPGVSDAESFITALQKLVSTYGGKD